MDDNVYPTAVTTSIPRTITAKVIKVEGKDGISYSMLDNGVVLVTAMRYPIARKTLTYEEGSGVECLVPPSVGFGPSQLYIACPTFVL